MQITAPGGGVEKYGLVGKLMRCGIQEGDLHRSNLSQKALEELKPLDTRGKHVHISRKTWGKLLP